MVDNELVAHPRDAVVIGGGISGLVAARELALAGYAVTVIEANSYFGGCVSPLTLSTGEDRQKITLDAGAEAFAVRTDAVANVLTELGMADHIVAPHPGGSWLYLPEGPVPSARVGILGIPGDLDAPEVRHALGEEGVIRAQQDLHDPMDRWRTALEADAPITVSDLVTDRLGKLVLDRLVAPVVAGVHSADPAQLDIRSVAPGLVQRAVELGSLSQAVATQRAAAPPGAMVASIRGGMHRLSTALVDELDNHGATLLTGVVATAIQRDPSMHGWSVQCEDRKLSAAQVVVATDGPRAWDLLAPASEGALEHDQRPPEGSGVALVSLLVQHPGLDASPRGTGLLVAPTVDPSEVGAKAMTHASAKWQWVADSVKECQAHVVRLSYGRVTDTADSAGLGYHTEDAALQQAATRDVATLAGLDPAGLKVLDSVVTRWRSALPVASPEHRERIAQMREWAQKETGLEVVGAWVAGTGLAAVVQQARQQARTLIESLNGSDPGSNTTRKIVES